VPKNSGAIELNGAVDEAQAMLGWSRSLCDPSQRLHDVLISLERDLWVLMAEVATAPENRHKLVPEKSRVTLQMITRLEGEIDQLSNETPMPTEFVVPGRTNSRRHSMSRERSFVAPSAWPWRVRSMTHWS